jgi:hypothetical protein
LHSLQIGFHLGLKLFCELEGHPLQQCEDVALVRRYHNKGDGLVNWRAFICDYVNLGKKAATCKKHAYILCTLCSDYGKCSKLSCKCEHAKSHRSGTATTLSTMCACGHMFSLHKINLHAQGVEVGNISSCNTCATTSRHNLDKLLKHGELYVPILCQYDMSPCISAVIHISARLTCLSWCSFACIRYYQCDTGKSHVVRQGDSVLPLNTGGTAIEHVIAVSSANALDSKHYDNYSTSSSNACDHTTSNGPNSSNTINVTTNSIDALSLMTDTDKACALLLVQSPTEQHISKPKNLQSSVSKTLNRTAPTTAMYLDTVEMMNVHGDIAIKNGQLSPVQSKKELQLGFIPSSSIIVGTADGKIINSSNIAELYCSTLRDLSKQGTADIVYNNSTGLSDYIIHRYAFFERHYSHIITDIETGSVNIHLLPLCSSIQDRKLLEAIKIKPDMVRAKVLKDAFAALGFTNRSRDIWPPEAVYSSNTTSTTSASVCTTQQIAQRNNDTGVNVLDDDGMHSITSSLISVLTPISRKHKVTSNINTASDKESTSSNLLKSRASVADSEAATTSSSLAYMIKCLPNTTSASFTKLQCSQRLRYLCEHAACGHVSITCTAAEVSVLLYTCSYSYSYSLITLYCMTCSFVIHCAVVVSRMQGI